ncbi:MAG: DsbA family protein [Actinomycetota bacterium]
MTDLEFFFDPICPWAWITSRWVVEVQGLRSYDVRWRPISLKVLNQHQTADWYTPEYRTMHSIGHQNLRVAAALDDRLGNQAMGAFYTALGTAGHTNGRRQDFMENSRGFTAECLTTAGLPGAFVEYLDDESLDAGIVASTETALERTGRDVGTPVLTFHPGAENEGSFFGPVIARIPRGDEALRLWNAVEIVATTPGVAELKRSLRGSPVFD